MVLPRKTDLYNRPEECQDLAPKLSPEHVPRWISSRRNIACALRTARLDSTRLTPIEKKRVNPRDPKYAKEKGSRSFEAICLRSRCRRR